MWKRNVSVFLIVATALFFAAYYSSDWEGLLRSSVIISIVSLALMIIHVNIEKNSEIYQRILSIVSGCFCGLYLYIALLQMDSVKPGTTQFVFRYIIGVGAPIIIMLIISNVINVVEERERSAKQRAKKSAWRIEAALPEQKADLARIVDALKTETIIGVESSFGNGKTFVLQLLKDQYTESAYEIIEIDILALNLENLWDYLIREIDRVLYRNRIMSLYSARIKTFLSRNSWGYFIADLFGYSVDSYSESFRGMCDELAKINKGIIIVFDDIDRVTDADLIRKIFYISEKLSVDDVGNRRIHIIYQYDPERLRALGFTHEYLDKYITIKIPLTNISFYRKIIHFLNEVNINESDKDG